MEIGETVRRSTWHRRPPGRRVFSTNPPYVFISEPDGVSHRDALRRRSLAQLAGVL